MDATPKKSKYTVLNRLFGKSRKRRARIAILTANILFFGGIGAFVAINSSSNASSTALSATPAGNTEITNPLDQLSSADIAVNVARVTNLPEQTAVTNTADSAIASLSVASTDDTIITKPQVVSSGLKSKNDITKYVTVPGDTISSIAAKFGVSAETIRQSNNLSGDTVAVGVELLISPIDGIVYIVQAGDTPESIASKFRASLNELVAFNDAQDGLQPGERIVVPDGQPPIQQRYNYASAANRGGFSFGTAPIYSPNGYDYGWCTWHAANRRAQVGRPIPSNMGNAITWLGVARSAGLPTGSEPRKWAVIYHLNIGGLGHVGFVEEVYPDGSFLVSDMNYPSWGRVTYRTVPASDKGKYRFIY